MRWSQAGAAGGRQTKATEKGNKSVNLGGFDNGQRAPGLQNNGKIFTLGGITALICYSLQLLVMVENKNAKVFSVKQGKEKKHKPKLFGGPRQTGKQW